MRYKIFLRITFLILTLILRINAEAIDRKVEIERICLDNNTSTVTLFWKPPIDICNSFKKYYIYSSENSAPWILQKVVLILSTSTESILLPNLTSDWKFKLTIHSSCDGLDSFVSSPQSIDQNKPPYLKLDSISFDQPSQKLIAGWQKNSASDTKGYWLYDSNNLVFNKLLSTNSTQAILGSFNFSNPSYISLASFDSCDLFAPINQSHKAVYLNGKIDTCLKNITLNWSLYKGEGWNDINQYLIYNLNNSGFKKSNNLLKAQNSLILNNITLGDSFCYYIRTKEVITNKTSSSNIVCFFTRKINNPTINYIEQVTVENNSSIRLVAKIVSPETDSLIVEKSTNDGPFSVLTKIKANDVNLLYTILDKQTNVHLNNYLYQIKTTNKCGNINSTSNIGKSILFKTPYLNGNSYTLNWNTYIGWENGIKDQILESSSNGFTWNKLRSYSPTLTNDVFEKNDVGEDSICLRVVNYEMMNSHFTNSSSVSNSICLKSVGLYFFPGTINPFSQNNIFRVYGKGIDPTRSKLEIFNRWGQKIFETSNIETGWNTSEQSDLSIGSYVYKASFFDVENHNYFKTGTIFIIK